jgi:3-methyladenine DNA glycosylase/8-oxoguanine DNA glycosylase
VSASRELRVEVSARWCYRLPRFGGRDGLTVLRGGVLHRLLHRHGLPVLVRVAALSGDRVLFGARSPDARAAAWAIERMRAALGVDDDLRPFHERFRRDPLIGAALRRDPGFRVLGRPQPFEALVFAICEQLIESERAAAIQRRLIAALGRRCRETGLRDSPDASAIAGQAPARLRSFDLSEARALALCRAAREVAAGRVDLDGPDHERAWRRLRAIPGIGSWTVQCLGLLGQGRLDQLPAGDLAYRKLVGRLRSGGDPRARASEGEVEEFFLPYAPWAGLAGAYALRAARGGASSTVRVSHGAPASPARSSFSFA